MGKRIRIGRRRLAGGLGAVLLASVQPAAALAKKKQKTRRIKQVFVASGPVSFPTTAGNGIFAPDLHVATNLQSPKLVGLALVLEGYTVSDPSSVDIMLVYDGDNFLAMSDAGGFTAVSNLALRFDESARRPVPESGALTSGTYQPTNYDGEDSDGTAGNRFIGFERLMKRNPDGPWSLLITPDQAISPGSKITGWRLELTLEVPR